MESVHVVIAPDSFKGTIAAGDAAAAMARGADAAGWTTTVLPMADGGEGTLDALGGANRSTVVSGPLGDPVEARWRLARRTAVVEMATASGFALVGGSDGNDPLAASTYGTGELVTAAAEAGARRIIVGAGGSATTDGGLGALRAMYPLQRFRGVELVVACDVRARFVEAADRFAAQKGASASQVQLLHNRLERLAQVYETEHGVDVRDLEGAGAAGGLAGGLAAAGAELVGGFDLVADEVELDVALESADLVITGEGFLDAESFEGKVVGGVADLAAHAGVPVLAVVGGGIYEDAGDALRAVSLTEHVGEARAVAEPARCLEELVRAELTA